MNTLSRFLVVTIAIPAFLFAFNQRGIERHLSERFFTDSMLKPGEMINGMVITTGVENANPFWALCSSTKQNDQSINVDCGELPYANLAIGHTFGVMDLMPQAIDWEELTWELSLDGHPIDLAAFGVYDFVTPGLAPRPSPVREVFKKSSAWNVVLVNPTPGAHRLQGQARSRAGAEAYTWAVNFTVGTPLQLAFCKASTP